MARRTSHAAVALALVAVIFTCGCERLFGVDFSNPPVSPPVSGSARADDAGGDVATTAAAPLWSFRGGPKLQGRSSVRVEQPTRIAWRYEATNSCAGEPLVAADGQVIVLSGDVSTPLELLAIQDGVARSVWTTPASSVDAPRMIAFGPEGSFYVSTPNLRRIGADGREVWSTSADLNSGGFLVVDEAQGQVVMATKASVAAVRASGTSAWTQTLAYGIDPRLALRDDGTVLFSGRKLNAYTAGGAPSWSSDVGLSPKFVLGPPVVSDADQTFLVALDYDYPTYQAQLFAVQTGGALGPHITLASDDACADLPSLLPDGTVLVPCQKRLYARDPHTLSETWSLDLPNTYAQRVVRPLPAVVDANGTIVVTTATVTSDPDASADVSTGEVLGISPTGTLLWRFPLPQGAWPLATVIGSGGSVVVCMDDRSILGLAP